MVDDETGAVLGQQEYPPVAIVSAAGKSPFVLVCDHASNRIPSEYDNLGLTPRQRLMHIAWDPGALGVAMELSEALDAPLIHSTVCRLVIDCNRDEGAPDLIPMVSERTQIAGNAEVSETERRNRIARFHTPFHRAIETLLDERAAAGQETILVTVHSFTPIYKDVPRPWEIGLIHGTDPSFTGALRDTLVADDPALNVGWNEPYAALNGVTHTLETHGDRRGIEATMIEIRHNEILDPEGVSLWAARLARCLTGARDRVRAGTRSPVQPELALGTIR